MCSSSATAPSALFCSVTILDLQSIELTINPRVVVIALRSSKVSVAYCIHGAAWKTCSAAESVDLRPGSKADMPATFGNVRYSPETDAAYEYTPGRDDERTAQAAG